MSSRLALVLGAVLAALAGPAAAGAMDPMGGMGGESPGEAASIEFASFAPPRLDVLVGDTVTWRNDSTRTHTVTSDDGTWASGRLVGNDLFSHRFDQAGAATYYCSLHPFMRGEVDVAQVLLDAPTEPGAPGRPYSLHGRAALPSGASVAIEADAGAGFQPAGTATVDDTGHFQLDVVPTATASYRAVAGDAISQPQQLLVLDRTLAAKAAGHGRRVTVDASVAPASPGAVVVLQLRLRDRFGWWPVAHARLDRSSRARFRLRVSHRVPARVVLTLKDQATVLASSATLHVGAR
jgi:plastocyanin